VIAVTDLTPIASKLAKLVRMFGTKNLSERAVAWKALIRTLDTFGADFNDLGDRIEHAGNGVLTESEMKEIYSAGIKEGARQVEQKMRSQAGHNTYGTPRFPSASDMATYCYQRIDDTDNDWEREFITNMMNWTRRRSLSVKQQDKLEQIYIKLGGKIS
jgi:hypothetical protein